MLKHNLIILVSLLCSGCAVQQLPDFCGPRCAAELPGKPAPDWYVYMAPETLAVMRAKTAYNAGQAAILARGGTWGAASYHRGAYSGEDACYRAREPWRLTHLRTDRQR